MYLVTPDEVSIIDMDGVEVIYINKESKSIKLNFRSGKGCELAKYRTVEQCKYVLGLIAGAIQGQEAVFYIPAEVDIDFARMHTSYVKTKANRRGGS